MTVVKTPFNKPFLVGKELFYISKSVLTGHISGNGTYTKKSQKFFEKNFGFKKTLLTTSCTDALEMCALLLNIKEGDEVIVPSFTFVSTALAFERQGAKIIFADSRNDHPGISEDSLKELITPKTKAIVVVHYAGVACDMDKLMALCKEHNLFLIEDAAQAIQSTYKGKYLGSFGHMATFSFHETKNIQCGEGGLLVINDEQFIERAEIIWEKGTNRAQFFRGEVNKYSWVDTGSSFLPSEIVAAFLYAQLEELDLIQNKRLKIWNRYNEALNMFFDHSKLSLPVIPSYASNNAHMYYFLFETGDLRCRFIEEFKKKGHHSVFHYLPLHDSPYYKENHDGRVLDKAISFSERLVRLPLFPELLDDEFDFEGLLKDLQETLDSILN